MRPAAEPPSRKKAIEDLGGEMELSAVNCWPVDVETHQRNHPAARHYIQDLEGAEPEAIVPEGRVDLRARRPRGPDAGLAGMPLLQPARGGKPTRDQGRMNPWISQRWLTSLDIQPLIVENVREFAAWGPLDQRGRPDPQKKGLSFEAWVKPLWELGYDAQ